MSSGEHFNVILVGAGISGLGIAHHIQEQCPAKGFVILEEKDTFGGTWDTFKYPGIRSDSDLYTFGYRFKPWTGAPVADGEYILSYLGDVIDEDKLDDKIRYNHKITGANWCSQAKRWTIDIFHKDTGENSQLTCDFFIWSGGYYDHNQGYTPNWAGLSDFKGDVIHPQFWSEDTDLSGKQVIVIGSGATAATVIPNIADDCEHVTMLQRSPTYFWTGENKNELADRLRLLEVPDNCVHEIVRRDLLQTQKEIQHASAQYPEYMKQEFLKGVREHVGDEITKQHFTPSYKPWQQRVAYVPDCDLFNAINDGKVSVVTNHIERFTENGIQLQSGEILEADVVITATGFNAIPIGGIPYTVDGKTLNPADAFTYRGIMISGFPNFAMMFGYLRTSWTMRVDLVADYICRLLNHMDQQQHKVVTPTLRPQDADMNRNSWIDEDEFNPGYFQRSGHLSPSSGDYEPWRFSPDYYEEKDQMPLFDLNEDALQYQ
ncbi:NAD(P)/FAD-dependent oxidoreductase [Maricurvus nonylphenolicus]|uniref:flavin-containing monooxygenase n=1 Tax=Maricurvus nonylphenolicus TaxID=1008307 RepID=UPI0036F35FF2